MASADIADSQPAALLEDKNISQPASTAVETIDSQTVSLSPAAVIATSWANILPPAADIVPAAAETEPEVAEIAPSVAVFVPAKSPFDSLPRSNVAGQFPGVLHPQDIVGNTILFSASFNTGVSDQMVPPLECGNQISALRQGNQIFMLGQGSRMLHPTPSKDRSHDAVFARSIARFWLMEVENLPDDSSAPADIETFFNDCLPLKSGKSFAHAIDAVLAAVHCQEWNRL